MKCLKKQRNLAYVKAQILQKREDLYRMDALFNYLDLFIIVTIIQKIINFIINEKGANEVPYLVVPLAVMLIMMLVQYRIKQHQFRQVLTREQLAKFRKKIDLVKLVICLILVVVILESRLLEIKHIEPDDRTQLFWICNEIMLLLMVTLLTVETRKAGFLMIGIVYVYCWVRFQGYAESQLNASFLVLKYLALMILIFRMVQFEKIASENKNKKYEEKKISKKVLDIMPEAIAIVSTEGLRFHNQSLKPILGMEETNSDDQIYKALMDLKNTEIKRVKQPTTPPKVSNDFQLKERLSQLSNPSAPTNLVRDSLKKLTTKEAGGGGDDQSVAGSLLNISKVEKKKSVKSFKDVQYGDNLLRPQDGSRSYLEGNKKVDDKYRDMFEYHVDSSMSQLEVSARDETNHDSETPAKKLGASMASLAMIKLKLKKFFDKRVNNPFKKSRYNTVKDAVEGILEKFKDEFPKDLPNLIKQHRKHSDTSSNIINLDRASSLNPEKEKKKNVSIAMHSCSIMLSEKEGSNEGEKQIFEIKFTPVIFYAQPSIMLVVRDITEKEQIKKLQEKEKTQTKAFASLSYEFRTPLNSIITMIESVFAILEKEDAKKFLLPAYNSAKLLLLLANNALDLFQIQEKKIRFYPQPVSLSQLIKDCFSVFQIQAKKKGLKLSHFISSEVNDRIISDPNRLQQILNNLVANALKFTLEGEIQVRIEPYLDSYLSFTIIDTGIGIKPENLRKMFVERDLGRTRVTELSNEVSFSLVVSDKLSRFFCKDQQLAGIKVESVYQKGSTFSFLIDRVDDDNVNRSKMGARDIPSITVLKEDSRHPTPKEEVKQQQLIEASFGDQEDENESTNLFKNMYQLNQGFTLELEDQGGAEKVFRGGQRKPSQISKTVRQLENKLKDHIFLNIMPNKTPKALIADDNDFNQIALDHILTPLGFKVTCVYSGVKVIEQLKEQQKNSESSYDLIFLDCEMPIMNGIECCKEILKMMENQEIEKGKIVGLSAVGSDHEKERCLAVGMDDYLLRPILRSNILDILSKLLIGSK